MPAGSAFCAACGHAVGDGGAPGLPSEVVAAPSGRSGRTALVVGVVVLGVAVVVLAVIATVLITRSGDEGGELFLESATSTGQDPFTGSTATGNPPGSIPGTTVPTTGGGGGQTVVGTVQGGSVGLYGGTLNIASCDREQQIGFLQANPDKAAAFASVLGITTGQIPDYLRRLTPIVLLRDTRVTNHGFAQGSATSRQSVLQAGTAVLVDEYGIPRVRCYCGNPLTPPTAVGGTVRYQGQQWPGFSLDRTVVVTGDVRITVFVLVNLQNGSLFERPAGSGGNQDKPYGGGSGTTTSSIGASSTTNTTSGGSGGGTVAVCSDTADGAVDRLLDARRRRDEVTARTCGSTQVVDYLWRLDDGFVQTLRLQSCQATTQYGPTQYNDEVDSCPLSNNAILVVPRTARPPNANWIASFVVLVEQPPSTTSGGGGSGSGGDQQACGSTQPSVTPATPAQKVLVDFFTAVNNKDYATAFGYLDNGMQSSYGGLAGFSSLMSEHVSCVRVLGISTATFDDPEVSASLGIQWYGVQLAAQYLTPFPAGSGQFPPFWKVHADPKEGAPPARITGTATGP